MSRLLRRTCPRVKSTRAERTNKIIRALRERVPTIHRCCPARAFVLCYLSHDHVHESRHWSHCCCCYCCRDHGRPVWTVRPGRRQRVRAARGGGGRPGNGEPPSENGKGRENSTPETRVGVGSGGVRVRFGQDGVVRVHGCARSEHNTTGCEACDVTMTSCPCKMLNLNHSASRWPWTVAIKLPADHRRHLPICERKIIKNNTLLFRPHHPRLELHISSEATR